MDDDVNDAGCEFERTGIKKRMPNRLLRKVNANRRERGAHTKDSVAYTRWKALHTRKSKIPQILHGLVLSLQVDFVPREILAEEAEEYFSGRTKNTTFTYARHNKTNYDDVLRRLNARGVGNYDIIIKLAVSRKIRETWKHLQTSCDLYEKLETEKFINEKGLERADLISLNPDGTLRWEIWE